jgi:mannose-6-phosphate isomerase-like protein (cupin superfamily)
MRVPIFAGAAVAALVVTLSCAPKEPPVAVPPLTTSAVPGATPAPREPAEVLAAASDASAAPAPAPAQPPVDVKLADLPAKVDAPVCSRVMVALAAGKATAAGHALSAGDVLVMTHPDPFEVQGHGVVAIARYDFPTTACAVKTRPALESVLVTANKAPPLTWAKGQMTAHLDVGAELSPEVYLGRLEGTLGVPEHTHDGAWEILVAIDAAGTFTLDGRPQRLGKRQIVRVPPGAKHAWAPDPGHRLVALQLYSPPGPEQRFKKLAAGQ